MATTQNRGRPVRRSPKRVRIKREMLERMQALGGIAAMERALGISNRMATKIAKADLDKGLVVDASSFAYLKEALVDAQYSPAVRIGVLLQDVTSKITLVPMIRAIATFLGAAPWVMADLGVLNRTFRYGTIFTDIEAFMLCARDMVRTFVRIHEECPQFDRSFFVGTGFLETYCGRAKQPYRYKGHVPLPAVSNCRHRGGEEKK